MAVAQGLDYKKALLEYQIQQEKALESVKMNIHKKIARLQNIANLTFELHQVTQAINQQNQQNQPLPPPPPQKLGELPIGCVYNDH